MKQQWCIPAVSSEYVACMEDMLDLYAEPDGEARPVVNFDEKSKQFVAGTRAVIPAAPGRPERFEYEHRRGGVANLIAFSEARAGWRDPRSGLPVHVLTL